jgi:hypothetical protein
MRRDAQSRFDGQPETARQSATAYPRQSVASPRKRSGHLFPVSGNGRWRGDKYLAAVTATLSVERVEVDSLMFEDSNETTGEMEPVGTPAEPATPVEPGTETPTEGAAPTEPETTTPGGPV